MVFGLDHLVTEQEASAGEIEALQNFLTREGTCLILGPHHDVGVSADLKERAMEYAHHGDPLVPRQQRFGKYTRSLMKGLSVPVENRYGLRPATHPGTTRTMPLNVAKDMDTRGWMEGVQTFVFHMHLPHYAVTTNDPKAIHVLARQPVDVSRPHPFVEAGNQRVQHVPLDAANGHTRRRHIAGRLDHLHDSIRRGREPGTLLEKPRYQMMSHAGDKTRFGLLIAFWVVMIAMQANAQNRGVYPLGMSATNSGVTPQPGFSYINQLLFYTRDHAKDDAGNTLPITGENNVLMDMNTLAWVSEKKFLGGANFSAVATLPFAKNDLTSEVQGNISGGGGFADSYYMPVILGWNKERFAIRAIYGFLAPTGRFVAGANDNVGSGYWTHALSSGQTFYLKKNKGLVFSAFQMYEFHTTQEGTGVHPGETFDLDYSLMAALPIAKDFHFRPDSSVMSSGKRPPRRDQRFLPRLRKNAMRSIRSVLR